MNNAFRILWLLAVACCQTTTLSTDPTDDTMTTGFNGGFGYVGAEDGDTIATMRAAIHRDATSGKLIPQSAAEWNALGYDGVSSIYLGQEAAGDLADSGPANITLTKNGSPTYRNAVPGWSTLALGFSQTASQGFYTAGVSSPNPNTDSIAEIRLAKVTSAGGARFLAGIAGANLAYSFSSVGKVTFQIQNGGSVSGTYDYRDGNVHPFGVRYNKATRTATFFSDQEILTLTYHQVTAAAHGWGGSGSTAPSSLGLYYANWQGPGAERIGAQTLVDIGWSLAYSAATDTGTSQRTYLADIVDGSRLCHAQLPAAFRVGASNGPYPLVIILGYYGRTGAAQQADLGFGDPLDGSITNLKDMGSGYIVLAPDGKTDSLGNNFWNSGPDADPDGNPINDTAYLGGLIDQAIANLPVDKNKVYIVGISSGANMANTLAAARSDVVTTIWAGMGTAAATSGGAILPSGSGGLATPSQPVNVALYAHTADPTCIYAGSFPGFSSPYTGPFVGHVTMLAFWASANGVSGTLQAAYDTISIDTNLAGNETSRQAYSGAPAHGAVEGWTNSGTFHIDTWDTANTYANIIGWCDANHR